MDNNLIVIKQLPIIEEQLEAVREAIQERTAQALALVCTEETYKDVKKVRSELNKEFQELETRRKEIKAQVMEPYEQFEKVYKDCTGAYAEADKQLKGKIGEVEDGLKKQKEAIVRAYFNAEAAERGMTADFITFERAGIKIGLSDTDSSLKKKADEWLNRVEADLLTIESGNNRDEVIAEYAKTLILSEAIRAVNERHKAIEEQKRIREEAEQRKAEQEAQKAAQEAQKPQETPAVQVPDDIPDMPDDIPDFASGPAKVVFQFTIEDTAERVEMLKAWMNANGYRFMMMG